MSEQILFTLLRTGVAVTVAAGLVFVTLRWSRCRSSRIHRIAWAFVLLQGVLWARIPLELPVFVAEKETKTVTTAVEETPEPMPFDAETDVMPINTTAFFETSPSVSSSWQVEPATVLLGVWAAGLIVVVALRCFGLYRLVRQMKSAKPDGHGFPHDKNFPILLTEHFGPAIFCNTILVPETLWEESSESVRLGILKHEISHARHRDGLKSLLLSLVAMLHWFNPAAWFALRKFNEAAEWRCDSEAFGTEKNGLAVFAESMLALNRSEPKYLAWVRPYKNQDIKERVRRLKEHHLTVKESTMKKIGILCLVAVLFCIGLVKVQLVAQTPKPEDAQAKNKPADGQSSVPKIVKMFPENNAVNVDPNISQVYLTFDRPMGGGMAWAQRDNNTALSADAADKFFWAEDRLTCVAPVQLKPNKKYEVLLNMEPFIGFRSVEGVPSKYVFYTFTTGDGPVDSKKREELAKNLFVKPDPDNPAKPPELDIHEKDGKFFLKTKTGDVEALPLSSVPVPEIKESDYGILSPAFRKIYILGAALGKPSDEEYKKLAPTFSDKYPAGGLVIHKPTKGFRADQAGLRPNDIIIGFDQWQIATMTHQQYFSKQRPDHDTVMKFWILRNDKLYYVDIPVESMADEKPADGGFVTGGQPGVSGFTHLVTFKPKGDFNPRNPGQFLAPFRTKLVQEGPMTGYFRTKPENGKLVGSLCTGDPDWLKRFIETVPEIEFVKSERLTKESFEAYNKTKQESLPPADGGFATPNGFTHFVAVGGKGDFVPKTKTQFTREISRTFQGSGIGFGVVRSRVEDGKLILVELTDDPEGFKKVVDASDTLQYLRTERLTKEFYDDYFQDYGDSHFLPPEDGGFTWHGHRYIVTCRAKGDFQPKTANDFYGEINKYMPWAFAGRPKTKMEGDRLLLMQLTDDAGILKETMDKSPTLEFVSAERLTKEKFEAYQGGP